jgi:hypothetical protein
VEDFDGFSTKRKNAIETLQNGSNDYAGFKWENRWHVVNYDYYNNDLHNNVTPVSGPNFLFNSHHGVSVSPTGGPVMFTGAYLASWHGKYEPLETLSASSVKINGYLAGKLVESTTVDLTDDLAFHATNWTHAVDSIEFDPGRKGGRLYNFAMDDFTFERASAPVPEPASLGLLGLGLLGAAGFRKSRKTAA